MLRCVWFWAQFKRLDRNILQNISTYVINNGMCTSQFEIERRVRQGDPMPPCLFIIVAEVLAAAIRTINIQRQQQRFIKVFP